MSTNAIWSFAGTVLAGGLSIVAWYWSRRAYKLGYADGVHAANRVMNAWIHANGMCGCPDGRHRRVDARPS